MSVLRASAAAWAVVSILGCNESKSRLEEQSSPLPSSPAPAPQSKAPEGQEKAGSDAAVDPESEAEAKAKEALAAGEPPPDAERVQLRLALEEGTAYRVTTVGMLTFPMMQQGTGFAREERITLEDCKGEGDARSCRVRHRYTQFEAEPPTGKVLEADEARVSKLETLHTIDPMGARTGGTEVRGTKEAVAAGPPELTEVHRLYCLRFPTEPVAVGAKWKSSCKTLTAGRVITRNVMWELSKLSDDPVSGKRAELRMVGEVLVPEGSESKKGTVQGILYFFVDKGQPHQLRERLSIPMTSSASSTRDMAYQFALVRPGKTEEFVRTDGQPLMPEDRPVPPPKDASEKGPPAGEAKEPA